MPVPPIDPFDPQAHNPFLLEKSKLLHAAETLKQATAARDTAVAASRTRASNENAALSGSNRPRAGQADREHFTISTRQIISLITRFRLRSLTYNQLYNLPFSQLSQDEKDFVNYLRRNPEVFEQIANLDHQPGMSVEDVKMASRLAGDALVLSDEDLQYLKQLPAARLQQSLQSQPMVGSAPVSGQPAATKLQAQDLVNLLQMLNQPDLDFAALMALDPQQAGLRGRNLESLRFLQSPTVSKVLEKLVTPYDGLLSPEVLRVLSSLMWNPAIYGAAPIVFYRSAPLPQETDIQPLNPMDTVDEVNDYNAKLRTPSFRPTLRLEAHHMREICHKLSQDGRVTLEQLRKYQPQSQDEEKVLNLLRQTHVFQALAALDREPEYLSDKDIQLALAEGALVLSDPYVVLVILP